MWVPETAALLQGKTVGPVSLSIQPASPGAAAVWTPAFPLLHAPAPVSRKPHSDGACWVVKEGVRSFHGSKGPVRGTVRAHRLAPLPSAHLGGSSHSLIRSVLLPHL